METLRRLLKPHLKLPQARLTCFLMLMPTVIGQRSVSLVWLARQGAHPAMAGSVSRRFSSAFPLSPPCPRGRLACWCSPSRPSQAAAVCMQWPATSGGAAKPTSTCQWSALSSKGSVFTPQRTGSLRCTASSSEVVGWRCGDSWMFWRWYPPCVRIEVANFRGSQASNSSSTGHATGTPSRWASRAFTGCCSDRRASPSSLGTWSLILSGSRCQKILSCSVISYQI